MTIPAIETIKTAHARAVKAAQKFEAVTPGTQAKERAWVAYEAAEKQFEAALNGPIDWWQPK